MAPYGAIWQVFDRIADRFQRLFSSSSDKAVMKWENVPLFIVENGHL